MKIFARPSLFGPMDWEAKLSFSPARLDARF
jgi:hypothetical protein